MFYKGSVTVIRRSRKYTFPQGIPMVFITLKVCYRMLINIMVHQWIYCTFWETDSRITNIPQVLEGFGKWFRQCRRMLFCQWFS